MAAETVDIIFSGGSGKVPNRIVGTDGRAYSVEGQIGRGGNAVVCSCADEIDGSELAVKFLVALRDEGGRRFERETSLTEKLTAARHDHLIRFVTSGQCQGEFAQYNRKSREVTLPFFIMERASSSLREFVGNLDAAIPQEIYVAQFRGLLGALETLHELAIHRDIKPENILVVGERWLISDFGLCAWNNKQDEQELTSQRHVPGPKFWMSPEANNKSVGLPDEIGFASDVFQLAAVFWWVVNRRHPSGILAREDWTGAEKLFDPVSKALQHSLGRRFETANEFGRAMATALAI